MVLLSAALAATVWSPICTSAADPTVWLVFEDPPTAAEPGKIVEAPGPTPTGCEAVTFGTVECSRTVGLATVRPGSRGPELKYAVIGDDTQLLAFLDRALGGVALTVPPPEPSPVPRPPPDADALVARYLDQRARASAPSLGVTLHVWTCPDAPTVAPVAPGIVVRNHAGRVVVR